MQINKPATRFSQKHLLAIRDYSPDDILHVLSLALRQKNGELCDQPLKGKVLAMIFAKSSTRTRVSFESGIYQLGGMGMFLSSNDLQLGRGEPISDTAKVLSRMVDGIMIRTFAQSDVEDLAKFGSIPVINGLTDLCHPCQAFADILTYFEYKKTFKGKIAFLGDGNNVCNSLMVICAKLGTDFAVACPSGSQPDADMVAAAKAAAAVSGSTVTITADPVEAVHDADCVYTDVWASMGQEAEHASRVQRFTAYQVNSKLVSHARPDYIFQHCLPAHRGEEVTAEIIDSDHSAVWDEAENRLHVQKAIMTLLMGGGG